MKNYEQLRMMLNSNIIGNYTHCEVIHVVLFSEEESINYFTHVNFSCPQDISPKFDFLTDKAIKITPQYQLAISRYVMPIEDFYNVFYTSLGSQKWKYKDYPVICFDDCFLTSPKFIPSIDPMGGKEKQFVPFEYYLYGTNFSGNYYIVELYSKKTKLRSLLNDAEIKKIQLQIKKYRLFFKLDILNDRIGNLVCKIPIKSLSVEYRSFGYQYGIHFKINRSENIINRPLILNILQKHDEMIYNNTIIPNYRDEDVDISPNQYFNIISIVDQETSLILYCGQFNFTFENGYYSHIVPPICTISTAGQRSIRTPEGKEEIINLNYLDYFGNVLEFIEQTNANRRKSRTFSSWFIDKRYLISYKMNQHSIAIQNIRDIVNLNGLLWDLQEICIIDPYLTAKDLIETVFYCKKRNIIIKALTSYSTIHARSKSKEEFKDFKDKQKQILLTSLGENNDINVEFRTVYNQYGYKFHDILF